MYPRNATPRSKASTRPNLGDDGVVYNPLIRAPISWGVWRWAGYLGKPTKHPRSKRPPPIQRRSTRTLPSARQSVAKLWPHSFFLKGKTLAHLANGPWNKSLNFIFPTEYVIPKSLKFSRWPSKLGMKGPYLEDPLTNWWLEDDIFPFGMVPFKVTCSFSGGVLGGSSQDL